MPRDVAFRILEEVERGRRLDRAWETAAPSLAPGERPWVQGLTHGTVRLRGRLDHLLDLHLSRGLDSLGTEVKILLRMGAYQLLYMGSVPEYAAVSETVDGVRRNVGGGLAGMANGVLRSLGREGGGEERFASIEEDPAGHLTTWGSHPRWLIDRWLARWDVEETARLVEWNNRIPALHLRPVSGPGVPEEEVSAALARLKEAGIEGEPGPPGSGTLRLAPSSDPRAALECLPSIVQDPAAAWVVAWAGDVGDLTAADLCSAPGGKAVGLWSAGARVVAMDPSIPRLKLVRGTSERLGAGIPLVAARGEQPPIRRRDLVLVDAPCTGTGTLARHPDARWRLRAGDPARMAEVQDTILDGAAKVVAEGGCLLYSTCSLEPEENEERVEAFLRRHHGFILEGKGDSGVRIPDDAVDGSFLRALPQRTGTDGAFAARLLHGG